MLSEVDVVGLTRVGVGRPSDLVLTKSSPFKGFLVVQIWRVRRHL